MPYYERQKNGSYKEAVNPLSRVAENIDQWQARRALLWWGLPPLGGFIILIWFSPLAWLFLIASFVGALPFIWVYILRRPINFILALGFAVIYKTETEADREKSKRPKEE